MVDDQNRQDHGQLSDEQCEPELCAEIDREIAFAPRMEPSESLKYRYALDVSDILGEKDRADRNR
jgi:hypothetical protein